MKCNIVYFFHLQICEFLQKHNSWSHNLYLILCHKVCKVSLVKLIAFQYLLYLNICMSLYT